MNNETKIKVIQKLSKIDNSFYALVKYMEESNDVNDFDMEETRQAAIRLLNEAFPSYEVV